MINIAVLGYGTVGSGVVNVIETNHSKVNQKSTDEINVKYILDLREFPGDPYESKVVHDFNTILEDGDIKIICETMGGTKPAYDFTKSALLKGISVCTSNKELVAQHGPELIKIAKENNCNYMFEASVGGGIPIIRPLNSSLTSEDVDAITGILNGTTNYILTKMENEGAAFEDVLKKAQELGYAEKNPEADVEGYDAGRKIAILTSLMAGKNMKFENVYTEGITKITSKDFDYAKAMNRTIKLFGLSRKENDEYYAMVSPFMVSKDHPMAMVNDVFNAIFVHGNTLGDTMYYGRGAGSLPTASAVVSDVIECARNIGNNVPVFWDAEDVKIKGVDDITHKFFVRVSSDKKDAALRVFGNIETVDSVVDGEFAFVTELMSEKNFKKSADEVSIISRIRLVD
ncbi:MAG: homoserine dehydrogenase [Lachnospiraceae bacterium]|nr:homoserine dehydrogenase [Lachnospiraceae bacterium]